MSKCYFTTITTSTVSVAEALDFVTDPAHGAMELFIGCVRNHNLGKQVLGVSYEVFALLAENILNDLCKQAQQRWGQNLRIYIAHFHGRLDINGISLVIGVSSPHRHEASQACHFILEEIKQKCPIWKQEHYIHEDSQWVTGHALCKHNN